MKNDFFSIDDETRCFIGLLIYGLYKSEKVTNSEKTKRLNAQKFNQVLKQYHIELDVKQVQQDYKRYFKSEKFDTKFLNFVKNLYFDVIES